MDGINEENADKYIATYSKLLSEVEKVKILNIDMYTE